MRSVTLLDRRFLDLGRLVQERVGLRRSVECLIGQLLSPHQSFGCVVHPLRARDQQPCRLDEPLGLVKQQPDGDAFLHHLGCHTLMGAIPYQGVDRQRLGLTTRGRRKDHQRTVGFSPPACDDGPAMAGKLVQVPPGESCCFQRLSVGRRRMSRPPLFWPVPRIVHAYPDPPSSGGATETPPPRPDGPSLATDARGAHTVYRYTEKSARAEE